MFQILIDYVEKQVGPLLAFGEDGGKIRNGSRNCAKKKIPIRLKFTLTADKNTSALLGSYI